MFCPKCGRTAEINDAICGGCDFILDTSFLGVGFVDDEQSQRLQKATGKEDVSPWSDYHNDSLILGDLSEHIASFHSSDTGLQEDRRSGMQVYVGASIQAMLTPFAVPVVQQLAMSESVRMNPFERHVLALTDGTQPVSRILQQSGLNREELYTALATLADKGYLKLREENTVIAPVPFWRADDEPGPDLGTEQGDATEVTDLGEELEKIRSARQDDDVQDDDPNADVFADDDGVFADSASGAALHEVSEGAGGETLAELQQPLSLEELPSQQAEERALAFAEELISEERTTVQERPFSVRSKNTRSEASRPGRNPPPLPPRDGISADGPERRNLSFPSNPSGGWLVETSEVEQGDGALEAPQQAGQEAAPSVAAHQATVVGEALVEIEALSVDFSSVFGGGDFSAADEPNVERKEAQADIDPDEVFATAEPPAAVDVNTSFQPAALPGAVDVHLVATGVIHPRDSSNEGYSSAIPTLSSEEGVALAPDGVDADAGLAPLPGANVELAVAAVQDNVFANQDAQAEVRPAARLAVVAEPVQPAMSPAPMPDPAQDVTRAMPHLEAPPIQVPRPAALPDPPARPPGPAVSFEYRRKAEKIFEEAEADFAAGRVGSARMNAKLASIYNPHEPRYQEILKRWEEMSLENVSPTNRSETPLRRLVEDAKRAERQGDFLSAADILREALEKDPLAAPLHNHLGVLLATRMQQFEAASAAIMRAIELAPQNLAYKNNLGKILARQAESEDARSDKRKGQMDMRRGAVMVKNIRPKLF